MTSRYNLRSSVGRCNGKYFLGRCRRQADRRHVSTCLLAHFRGLPGSTIFRAIDLAYHPLYARLPETAKELDPMEVASLHQQQHTCSHVTADPCRAKTWRKGT